jgi:ATP-dependent Lon protease
VLSALSGIPARGDVAMTGEMSLRGRVLPIGGLKEKTMAAYRNGIKTVIIPEDNKVDLEEVDQVVKDSIRFVTAKHIKTVLDTALVRKFVPVKELSNDSSAKTTGTLEYREEEEQRGEPLITH